MALTRGARLGAYEVVSQIGEGGMGKVYLGRDTTLGRQVAIKVLPDAFAADAERVARFEREARTLASLNHPNIAAVYGFETSGGMHALVMEFVDGEDVSQRLARGAIAVDDALPMARQIAEALEVAHDQGIVHRDLKPANIKVKPDGMVKVLDFGLAKALDAGAVGRDFSPAGRAGSRDPADVPLSQAPTITTPAMMTGVGVILGTAAYMSPEQAKGRAVNRRADIWAFGAVLFEMLTGRRVFSGEDVPDTLANVLKVEPDWASLPATTPVSVVRLLRRCLQKDPQKRLPHIGMARFELEDAQTAVINAEPSVVAAALSRSRMSSYGWIAAAVLLLTTVAGIVAAFRAQPAAPVVTRFLISAPAQTTFATNARVGTSARISPDGTRVAFTARAADGTVQLWVRALDSLTAVPLAGTDGAQVPFWSPDSQAIAFGAAGKLVRIAATGGTPQTLCPLPEGATASGTWGRDGVIVFSAGATSTLLKVPAAGGQPEPVTTLGAGHLRHSFPSFLPDGRHLLLYVTAVATDISGLYVTSLDTGELTRIADADTGAVYSPRTSDLLFVRQGTLVAQAFNAQTLLATNAAVPIADGVESIVFDVPAFSVSDTGVLAYGTASSSPGIRMVWVDRQGKPNDALGPQGNYRGLDLSPDGRRVAAHRHDGTGGDIWVSDVSRGTTARFTFDPSQENSSPVWSPDGNAVAFGSLRMGKWGLYQRPADGNGREDTLLESADQVLPLGWSQDGRSLVFVVNDPKTGRDIWVLPLTGARTAMPLLQTSANDGHGQVSPDGRWLAYNANDTGETEIYIRSFPEGSSRFQVSSGGGFYPRWRADGAEIFYMNRGSAGALMAVDVLASGSTTVDLGTPRELFDSAYINLAHSGPYHPYAVAPDGQRFLIPRPPSVGETTDAPIAVVMNWAAELKK